jgi:peptide/nickel transport system substrate-binding protein
MLHPTKSHHIQRSKIVKDKMRKPGRTFNWLIVLAVLSLLIPLNTLAAPSAQEITCEVQYIVQADDWLSKIADKYFGNPAAYPAIVQATNQKSQSDAAFAQISDPDLIEVGWMLCVPDEETTRVLLEGTAVSPAGPEGTTYAEEVVIGVGRNLYYGHTSIEIIHNSLQVWEPLIYPDENLNPQPLLARDWESNDDATQWTIYLREGVYFHDGTLLTADIAVANLEKDLAEYPIATLDRIEAVDDYTLNIYLSGSTPTLPNLLANYASAMLSPATWEQEGVDIPIPFGTGPFKFEDYEDGEKIILVRNDDYWGQPAQTERIVYRYIPDANTRLLALQSGEIDAIADVGSIIPSQGQIVEADEDLRLLLQDVVTTHYLFFNNDKPPFDNQALRQAVSMAIDRELIVNEAVYGYGVPAVSNITQLAIGWVNPQAEPEYDLEQAKALAASVLGDEPESVTFVLSSSLANRWPYGEIAQIIQYTLADLGLGVEIQTVEGGTWNEMLANDEYDMSMRPYTLSSGDPDDFMTYWVRSDGIFNKKYSISYSDREAEDLVAKALVDVDVEARRAYYDELQLLLKDQVPFTPVYHEATLYATRDNVYGLSLDPIFKPSLTTVYKIVE